MSILIVYDNTVLPGEMVGEIIGKKSFGDVIVKRKQFKYHFREAIEKIFQADPFSWTEVDHLYEFETLLQNLLRRRAGDCVRVLHCFSNFVISDPETAGYTLKKISYIEEQIVLDGEDASPVGMMFKNTDAYLSFLKQVMAAQDSVTAIQEIRDPHLVCGGMINIGTIRNFIQCLTGNFDSRYFNAMEETDYILRKSSSNKTKIKSEYEYYHMLPEKMQRWFVMPFDYQETGTTASYAMERLYMTDLAIKWVHGSVEEGEFRQILDLYFTFFRERCSKEVTLEQYKAANNKLYVDKVRERIETVKKLPAFSKIAYLVSADQSIGSLDRIFDRYLAAKEKIESGVEFPCVSVIGHGDPCFANTMYNKSTRTMKFIDPRGALNEEELYTDPYYDIAKLSHSICGNYDFFNNALFDITIDEDFKYRLTIPFDNRIYKNIFREVLEKNGYDYWAVRLYEASLFISMLPYHIDYPHKVFGFILNAVNILQEVENHV